MPPADAEVTLDKIGQIAIRVLDIERAVAFYRDKLGMQFLFRVPNMAFFDCGGVRLLLGLPEGPALDHPSSIIYFSVEDIERVYVALLDRGVGFGGAPRCIAKMPDHELWMASFEDPDGNTLALMSEVR